MIFQSKVCPSNAVTSIASAKCGDYFVQNQIVYQCISSAEGCATLKAQGFIVVLFP